jgi:hypothetical protein
MPGKGEGKRTWSVFFTEATTADYNEEEKSERAESLFTPQT